MTPVDRDLEAIRDAAVRFYLLILIYVRD